MTAVPRTTHSYPSPTYTDRENAYNCLAIKHGDISGWIELAYAKGNPKDGLNREWHWYSLESTAPIVERACELARRYGDVYTSESVYSQRKRAKEYVLPSASLFVDDVRPDHLPVAPTFCLETSNGNYQATFMLDVRADVATREGLAARLAMVTGGDASGWDATQIIRLPLGYNTKRDPFPVQLVECDATRRYTIAQLDAVLPAYTAPSTSHDALESALAVNAAAIPLARLLDRDGLPRRWKPKVANEYKRRILEQDSSRVRWWLAHSLRLHGYPAVEAYAILDHVTVGTSATRRKGANWYHDDIVRCLGDAWVNIPNVKEHATPANFDDLKPKPAKPVGRPNALSADQLYTLYKHNADTIRCYAGTIADAAKLAKVSIRTISNLEYELKQRGLIARKSRGRLSWVLFLDAEDAKITHAKIPETAPKTAQKNDNFCMGNDAAFSPTESLESAVSKNQHVNLGDHTPLENPPTAHAVSSPSLRLGACVPPELSQLSTGDAEQPMHEMQEKCPMGSVARDYACMEHLEKTAPIERKQTKNPNDLGLDYIRPANELHKATVAPLDPALIAKLPKASGVFIRPILRRRVDHTADVTAFTPPDAHAAQPTTSGAAIPTKNTNELPQSEGEISQTFDAVSQPVGQPDSASLLVNPIQPARWSTRFSQPVGQPDSASPLVNPIQPATARQLIGRAIMPTHLPTIRAEYERLKSAVWTLPESERGAVFGRMARLDNQWLVLSEQDGHEAISLKELCRKSKGKTKKSKQAALEVMRA